MERRLVMSLMTLRDSMTSNSWRHNLQSCRIGKLGSGSTRSIHVEPLSTQYPRTLCFKISSFGLELWEKKHLA